MNFWVKFGISEAVKVAQMLSSNPHIPDELANALVKFIDAGNKVLEMM